MKHENFLKLLTLRDRIKLDSAPKITNKSMLKDEINNTIDEALKYLDNRTSSLWTSYYMEKFLEWFCLNCLGGKVEPSQLSHKQKNEIFKDVFNKSQYNYDRNDLIVDVTRSTLEGNFKKFKRIVCTQIEEYFKQPMVTPEDFSENLSHSPSKNTCSQIVAVLMEVIADEAGWRSRQLCDEEINPAVQAKIHELGELLTK